MQFVIVLAAMNQKGQSSQRKICKRLNPKSEVQRRHPLPSFAAQGITDLGAALLDAAHCGHETPCTSKPGNVFLAFYFGSRAESLRVPRPAVPVAMHFLQTWCFQRPHDTKSQPPSTRVIPNGFRPTGILRFELRISRSSRSTAELL